MIMSQERAFLEAERGLQAMEAFVEQAARDERRIDQVERELFGRLLAVGLALLEAFVAAQGDGDAGGRAPDRRRSYGPPIARAARATLLVDLR